ncbi:MAG: sigma 54-interacting transcriptional regulator [Mogibacterium sp.]|nr:sigma 54-interacting transcriptional regulator [Mogibacterium sp.]
MNKQMTEQEELEYLRLIFNNSDNPLFIIDKSGKTLLANNATYKQYNCSKEEFEEKYSDSYKMKAEGNYKETVFEQVMEKKTDITAWNYLMVPGRRPKQIYVSESPIFDADGNVRYVVGQDIPRERIEKQYASITLAPPPTSGIRITSRKSGDLIYVSESMGRAANVMSRIAQTSAHVLIQGETGTGKDVSARFIHSMSPRRDKDMVFLNCAAMSPSLFETEMFGYEGGSFTGASDAGKPGLIETAEGSTLFLDEIDSIPLECQGKLLRVLETKRVRRVGSNTPREVDFRLIVATNKDLEKLAKEGKFREDLYYRLNILSVTLPPLRDRMEDVRPLAAHFLEEMCKNYGIRKSFSEEVYRELEEYDWPGNVRELRNTIERVLLTSDLTVQEIRSIPMPYSAKKVDPTVSSMPSGSNSTATTAGTDAASLPEGSLNQIVDDFEKDLIERSLREYGTITEAAKHLGVSISTLSRKAAKYGISGK